MDPLAEEWVARALARHARRRERGDGVVSCVLSNAPTAPSSPRSLEARWAAWLTAARAAARPAAVRAVARATGRSVEDAEAVLALGAAESRALIERASSALSPPRNLGVLEALAPTFEAERALDLDAARALASLAPLPVLRLEHPSARELAWALSAVESCPELPIVVTLTPAELESIERTLTTALVDRLRLGLVAPASDVHDARSPSAPGPQPRADLEPTWSAARAALATNDLDGARSLAERLLFEALEARPETRGLFVLNHRMAGVLFGPREVEIDLAAPALALAVEVDGYFHFQELDAYRRDRRKDALLQRHGLLVVRVLAADVIERLDEVMDVVLENVRHARGRTARKDEPR